MGVFFLRRGSVSGLILTPSELQFLDKVYINGEVVETATGYDTVEDAIRRATALSVPTTSTTTISYTTLSAINNGAATGTAAYSNFNVYSNKSEALLFTQSAVSNGGAEKSFTGISDGYYLMIATENYGVEQYYAYIFRA